MRDIGFRVVMAVVLAAIGTPALRAEPDLLRPDNLKTMGMAAPDTKHVLVASSQAGNVFYPGDAVDLTVKVTRGGRSTPRSRSRRPRTWSRSPCSRILRVPSPGPRMP
jgi:hypothetical protein